MFKGRAKASVSNVLANKENDNREEDLPEKLNYVVRYGTVKSWKA
jgi:hypothetical protein